MHTTSARGSDGVVRIRRRGLTLPRALGLVVALGAVGVAFLVHLRVGYDRMEVACSEGPASVVSMGWSLTDGFTCRFADGSERASLLWLSPAGDA